jgi:probable HAF family extracellular repeat protein
MKLKIAIASLVFFSNTHAVELQYSITQVGINNANYAFRPLKINDQGLILGQQKDPDVHRSPFFPFLAKPNDSGAWDVSRLPQYFSSVNNEGKAVGFSTNEGIYTGEINGGITSLDVTFGEQSVSTSDINNAGQIIGDGRITSNSQIHANIASSTDSGWGVIDLGTLGGENSHAKAINNIGIVVGQSEIAPGSRTTNAFAAANTSNGWTMYNIGTLDGDNSYALDVNNSNQVVGFSDHWDGTQHAFLAEHNGSRWNLTDLGQARNDNIYQSNTIQINDSGYIVWNDLSTAYLYANSQKHKLIDLIPSHSEWQTVSKVTSISNNGKIVGSGKDSEGNCCAGYVLTPIIEPTSSNPPICEAGVDPQTIRAGEGTALWWWSQNGSSGSINHGLGNVSVPSDYKWVTPTETTTYKMTVQGESGATTTCEATVIVEGQAQQNPPVCAIGLDPQVITAGEGTALWWWTQNTNSANIDNNIGGVELPTNYKWFFPSETTTYKMTAMGANGQSTFCQTTITVE